MVSRTYATKTELERVEQLFNGYATLGNLKDTNQSIEKLA